MVFYASFAHGVPASGIIRAWSVYQTDDLTQSITSLKGTFYRGHFTSAIVGYLSGE